MESNPIRKRLEVSPMLCRFAARHTDGLRPKTNADLARETGLSRSTIASLSMKADWGDVTVDVAERFAVACRVDPFSLSKLRKFICQHKLVYLRNASPAQKRMYDRILSSAGTRHLRASGLSNGGEEVCASNDATGSRSLTHLHD